MLPVLSKKPARIERTVSVSSDVSQASQVSTQSNTATSSTAGSAAGSKKPLKRQSLLPPSTSSAKQGRQAYLCMVHILQVCPGCCL